VKDGCCIKNLYLHIPDLHKFFDGIIYAGRNGSFIEELKSRKTKLGVGSLKGKRKVLTN